MFKSNILNTEAEKAHILHIVLMVNEHNSCFIKINIIKI